MPGQREQEALRAVRRERHGLTLVLAVSPCAAGEGPVGRLESGCVVLMAPRWETAGAAPWGH